MKEKGYEIVGKPCRGAACGRDDCPLYMRKAEKLFNPPKASDYQKSSKEMVRRFDAGAPAEQVFAV